MRLDPPSSPVDGGGSVYQRKTASQMVGSPGAVHSTR